MTTTKKDIMRKLKNRRENETDFRRQLAKHIPDLWKYAKSLHANQDKAYSLLAATISRAVMVHEQGTIKPDYDHLSRLMYMQFLEDFGKSEIDPKPYIFANPVRANLIAITPGHCEKAVSVH